MREIKFRAWNTHTKMMVDLKKITPFALDQKLGECDGLFLPFRDVFILMQFTGLKDKNGKDIYEGDIISKQGAFVLWDNDCFCWSFNFEGDKNTARPLFHDLKGLLGCEVIGNIHEHSHLLTPTPKVNNNGR